MGMGTPLPLEQGSPQAQRDVKGPASGTVTTRTTRECSCGPGSSSSGMRMHSSFSRAIAVPSTPHPTMWRFRSAVGSALPLLHHHWRSGAPGRHMLPAQQGRDGLVNAVPPMPRPDCRRRSVGDPVRPRLVLCCTTQLKAQVIFCPNHCGHLLSPASEYLTRHKTTRTCTSYEPSPSPTITDTGGCCYTVRTTDSKVPTPRHDSQNAETVKTVLACTSSKHGLNYYYYRRIGLNTKICHVN